MSQPPVSQPALFAPASSAAARPIESAETVSAAVSLTGVTRRFGHKWALRGIELAVGFGDLVVIQGHNGGGKSTLLRVIATAVSPTGGTGRVLGHDLRRQAKEIRTACALLGTSNGHYDDLSAHENLLFAARMLGIEQPLKRVPEALERVGLRNDADERVRAFSSGMQRRLALARLLLQRPRLLLLDEPFNTLDVEGAQLVLSLITDTRNRGGAAVVVLHDLARLGTTPTASYVMTAGRLS